MKRLINLTTRHWKKALYPALGLGALLLGVSFLRGGNEALSADGILTAPVRAGSMTISVTESGNLRSLRYEEIKNEISSPAGTKVLKIIPEGYEITHKDISEGTILLELDSTALQDEALGQSVEYESALALYIEAAEGLSIQASDNQSALKVQEQAARNALLNFEKYLGQALSAEVLKKVSLPYNDDTFQEFEKSLQKESDRTAQQISVEKEGLELATTGAPLEFPERIMSAKDYMALLNHPLLSEGEAIERLRTLRDELLLSKSNLALAEEESEASKKLASRGFLTRSSLEKELVNLEKTRLAVRSSETKVNLFERYEFPKEVESRLSIYEEALKNYNRGVKTARARMAQADSRYRSARRRYHLSKKKKEELEYQLSRTVIRATTPGIVSYGSQKRSRNRNEEPIAEGGTVRFGQVLLTIPDMNRMAVDVDVHESQIKKINPGLQARVRLDAEPDAQLLGTLTEVAILPDSSNSFFNPSLKVYPCVVNIETNSNSVRPGMSAKVEIIIDEIKNALSIPIQAVYSEGRKRFCYVKNGRSAVKKYITTGASNDSLVQILDGLKPEEEVLLSAPAGATDSKKDAEEGSEHQSEEPKGQPGNRQDRADREVDSQLAAKPNANPPGKKNPAELKPAPAASIPETSDQPPAAAQAEPKQEEKSPALEINTTDTKETAAPTTSSQARVP